MTAKEILSRQFLVFLTCAALMLLAAACGADSIPKDCPTYEEKPMTVEEQAARKEYVAQMEAKAREIRPKYDDLFWRQPNVIAVSIGLLTCLPPIDGRPPVGFKIRVTKKVDQSTLPAEDRIPEMIEGVPVQLSEGRHFEFLGGK